MSKKVLISGASIAGNAAAWWLGHYGFDVTVLEKAAGFRDGGQNIDIRGAGRDVLKKMGLEQAALENGTGEEGTAWVHADGSVIAEFDTKDMGADGPTAEMEILRGDLARLLYEPAQKHATYRFGDSIEALSEVGEMVSVTFQSGQTETFDAVVIAEGVGSATRDIIFPGENDPRWLDMSIGYFTVPKTAADDKLWRWYHTTGGRSASLRPDQHGTMRAMLTVQKPAGEEADMTPEQQKEWLAEQFRDVEWETPRILEAMADTEDFYFDVLRQVQMPTWSKGRVVLTGDAAWCVTPLGGVGATLAVIGAYVLAGEMAEQGDVVSAFTRYEARLRKFVDDAQGIPKIAPRMANPHSRLGLALLYGTLKLASTPGVRQSIGKLLAGKSDDFVLPDYRSPLG